MEISKKNKDYFKLVGRLTSTISKSDTLEKALLTSLDYILGYNVANYTIIWFCNEKDELLYPYYTVCPIDITSKTIKKNNSAINNIMENSQTVAMLSFEKDSKKPEYKDYANLLSSVYEGIDIKSIVAIPIVINNKTLGMIHFINDNPNQKLDAEDVDTLSLFSETLSFFIEESNLTNVSKKFNEVVISGREITKEFQNANIVTKILKGVNIDVYKGEFLVLLGESGCGKTTLLNIIGGLDTMTSGSLIFEGQNVSRLSDEELTKIRRDNIGFVFQSYNLMGNINAKQNIDLIAELVDNPMDSLDALDIVDLKDKKDNYPSQMSGGQQQRVSIARAIVKNPKIIIADEPTAALDYETSLEVLKVFSDVVAAGATLIMVTHNEEIAKMADRVIKLRNGKVHNIYVNYNPLSYNELIW